LRSNSTRGEELILKEHKETLCHLRYLSLFLKCSWYQKGKTSRGKSRNTLWEQPDPRYIYPEPSTGITPSTKDFPFETEKRFMKGRVSG
jgi:hypothetical protein